MALKVQILRCSRRLFIILVSLTMTWFSEKMLISTRCIHGFMSNLIKKSWTDSNPQCRIFQSLLCNGCRRMISDTEKMHFLNSCNLIFHSFSIFPTKSLKKIFLHECLIEKRLGRNNSTTPFMTNYKTVCQNRRIHTLL